MKIFFHFILFYLELHHMKVSSSSSQNIVIFILSSYFSILFFHHHLIPLSFFLYIIINKLKKTPANLTQWYFFYMKKMKKRLRNIRQRGCNETSKDQRKIKKITVDEMKWIEKKRKIKKIVLKSIIKSHLRCCSSFLFSLSSYKLGVRVAMNEMFVHWKQKNTMTMRWCLWGIKSFMWARCDLLFWT